MPQLIATDTVIKIDDRQLKDVGVALREVAEKNRTRIMYRALNRTGDMTYTKVKAVLVKETGLRPGRVSNALTKHKAGPGRLVYIIDGKGGFFKITKGNFGAKQIGRSGRSMTRRMSKSQGFGVMHHAWGRHQIADGAFIPKGMSVAFRRLGPKRLPIKALYGPAIPREMIRGKTGEVAPGVVQAVFIPRVMHEIDREIKAAKARHGL